MADDAVISMLLSGLIHTADEIIGNEELLANIVLSYTRNRNGYNMESDVAAKDAIQDELSKAETDGLIPRISENMR